jgi:hypothetical protein
MRVQRFGGKHRVRILLRDGRTVYGGSEEPGALFNLVIEGAGGKTLLDLLREAGFGCIGSWRDFVKDFGTVKTVRGQEVFESCMC